MNAILFVGHGSRDAEGNEEVRAFVSSIAERLEQPIVETCFLEFEEPSVRKGIDTCVQRGASRVIVVPIVLFAAGHAKLHIPAMIDDAKLRYPLIQFTYARPIGVHEQVLEILASRLEDTGINRGAELEDTALLVVGRGSSDADANSDLFKISRLLWERLKIKWVETAFIGVTAPLVDEGIDRCLKLGARQVVVLPYFLFTGVLIKRMEQLVKGYSERYSEVSFKLANYFGFHPILRTILQERAEEAIRDEVKMSCDMCVFRLEAMHHMDHHHHHHDHDHDPHHHNHNHNHDHDHHDHDHDHGHDHEHILVKGKVQV